MRFAYVLTITMLLAGAAAPASFAQGNSRARGNTDAANNRSERDDVYRSGSRSTDDGYRTGRASDDDDGYRSGRSSDDDGYRTGRAPQRDDRVDRRDDDRRDGRVYRRDDDYYDRDGKGKGPKFCQNGQGHPVHGRAWCEEHGFGNGRLHYPGDYRYPDGRRDPVWRNNRSWEDVIFGRSHRDYPRNRQMSRSVLQDILGAPMYRRFDGYRRDNRVGGSLVGYWINPGTSRGRALQIDAGRVPLARLFDYNGDGRVDAVQLNRLR
ncbi:MAG TPA: hypothetical protein VFG50_07760 [Rhodothermales bacterium]|nr:hypothetical protein [Rhodothermales bacterium]